MLILSLRPSPPSPPPSLLPPSLSQVTQTWIQPSHSPATTWWNSVHSPPPTKTEPATNFETLQNTLSRIPPTICVMPGNSTLKALSLQLSVNTHSLSSASTSIGPLEVGFVSPLSWYNYSSQYKKENTLGNCPGDLRGCCLLCMCYAFLCVYTHVHVLYIRD